MSSGTLRCLERLPPERVTARAIADESGANVASINYHFASKDDLVSVAVITGLDRWLENIAGGFGDLRERAPAERLRAAGELIRATRKSHSGLARNFLGALARAQHDPRIAELLAEGFGRTRPSIATLLGLGDDQAGEDAAGLVHSLFIGLLFQALLDPDLAIEGERMALAQARLRELLPVREERNPIAVETGLR